MLTIILSPKVSECVSDQVQHENLFAVCANFVLLTVIDANAKLQLQRKLI